MNEEIKVSDCLTKNKMWDKYKFITDVGRLVTEEICRNLKFEFGFFDKKNEVEDEMCWSMIDNGIFLIKLVIWLVYGISLKENVNLNFCLIWKLDVLFNIKIFYGN